MTKVARMLLVLAVAAGLGTAMAVALERMQPVWIERLFGPAPVSADDGAEHGAPNDLGVPAPLPAQALADASYRPVQGRANCAWSRPGSDRWRGDTYSALLAMNLPPAVAMKVLQRIEARQHDSLVHFSNKAVWADNGLQFSDRFAMTFANAVCFGTRAAFVDDGRVESGHLYSEAGYHIAVPTVCGNVTLLQAGAVSPRRQSVRVAQAAGEPALAAPDWPAVDPLPAVPLPPVAPVPPGLLQPAGLASTVERGLAPQDTAGPFLGTGPGAPQPAPALLPGVPGWLPVPLAPDRAGAPGPLSAVDAPAAALPNAPLPVIAPLAALPAGLPGTPLPVAQPAALHATVPEPASAACVLLGLTLMRLALAARRRTHRG